MIQDRTGNVHGGQEEDFPFAASLSTFCQTGEESQGRLPDDSLSPVRVPQVPEARCVLETTPPPEDAATITTDQPRDELDALFGRVRPNERGKSNQISNHDEPKATSTLSIGLRDGASKTSAVLIGDGGASWRRKALRRAQQRATEEGRALDDEVKQRFDSIAVLSSAQLFWHICEYSEGLL
jgi:hypothetical protein